MRLLLSVIVFVVMASACGSGAEPPSGSTAAATTAADDADTASGPVEGAEFERTVLEIMSKAGVPGISAAVVDGGRVTWVASLGLRSTDSNEPVDAGTVFAAASLSKPVFAHLVMLLTEDGTLDLDRPLEQYLGRSLGQHPDFTDLAGDHRTGVITARHVLSHSTGLPNWRFLTDDGKLRLLFDPGTRFNYSGEGIVLLQHVIEEVTDRGLEELAQERIFAPLGMTRTSYVWQDRFDDNHAVPHDEFERARQLNRRRDADAAGSLMTTAGDYARFLTTLLGGEDGSGNVVEAMLVPQVTIDSPQMFGARGQRTSENEKIALAWGLGWGRFDTPDGRAIFHTGHDIGWQSYTVTHVDAATGVVLLSNSDNFESVARELVAAALGEEGSPFDWLGYPVFDPTERREPPPDPVAIELDRQVMQRYVGAYEALGRRLEVDLVDDQLWLSEGNEATELRALSDTEFFVVGDDARFRFELIDGGIVERLVIVIDGIELPATRL